MSPYGNALKIVFWEKTNNFALSEFSASDRP